MQLTTSAPSAVVAPVQKKTEVIQQDEIILGSWHFMDGVELRITLRGEIEKVDIDDALSMAETLIEWKRKEIAKRMSRLESLGLKLPGEK